MIILLKIFSLVKKHYLLCIILSLFAILFFYPDYPLDPPVVGNTENVNTKVEYYAETTEVEPEIERERKKSYKFGGGFSALSYVTITAVLMGIIITRLVNG